MRASLPLELGAWIGGLEPPTHQEVTGGDWVWLCLQCHKGTQGGLELIPCLE